MALLVRENLGAYHTPPKNFYRPKLIIVILCIILTQTTSADVGMNQRKLEQDTISKDPLTIEEHRRLNVFGNLNPNIGPWPECIGWFSDDCADYIRSEAADQVKVAVIRPPPTVVMTADESGGDGTGSVTITGDNHRVQVRVDEYNVVVAVPSRG